MSVFYGKSPEGIYHKNGLFIITNGQDVTLILNGRRSNSNFGD